MAVRREQLINNASTTLNGAITDVATSITVTDGSIFPVDSDFRILIEDEIMKVTQVATNTLTVERGAESTANVAHSDTTQVDAIVTAGGLTAYWDQRNDFGPSLRPPAKIMDDSNVVMTSTDFTWLNQGTATITDEANGNLTLQVPTNSSSHVWRGMEITPSATPWTIQAHIQVGPGFLNGASGLFWGVFMRETSSSNLITLYNKAFNLGGVAKWTDTTTFSTTSKTFDNGYNRAWFKLSDDGTDITFSVSVDGVDWFEALSEARGTFFTTGPDRVGFCMNPYATSGPGNTAEMYIISWSQT